MESACNIVFKTEKRLNSNKYIGNKVGVGL